MDLVLYRGLLLRPFYNDTQFAFDVLLIILLLLL